MLIRITGGSEGIAEYLVNGQKQDREMSRDELDDRVKLEGDLELTDAIIKGMEKEGERYLHVTIAFKEDSLDLETLKAITSDFCQFAMSAYESDEFNFYAEAHIPKLKSYPNRLTTKFVERKPHIHIVIPEQNLLSGQNLNPFGKVEQQVKFLEAFQEHANAKYGSASPKDNRRIEFTGESEMISRYKGDLFQGNTRALKERILSDVLDRKISDYDSFKKLLAEHGAMRSRNAGQDGEYQNLKPADQAKGVNFKDYVFSREFIEKPDPEKRQFLADEGRRQYESQQPARPTAPELVARLDEWHAVRAPELKYINSGNRKLYAAYRGADQDGKRAMLAERAERFYAKHQAIRDGWDTGESKIFNQKGKHNERPDYEKITRNHAQRGQRAANLYQSNLAIDRRRAPPGNLSSLRDLSSIDMVQHADAAQMLLHSDASARVGRGGESGDELRRPRAGDSRAAGIPQSIDVKGRGTDSVIGQLIGEQKEAKAAAKGAADPEFAQIKLELDARRLLAHLSRTHGVIPEKYEVTKGKDGGDRIKAGTRNLNVSDFLTQEVRLKFEDAKPILRQVYAAQQQGLEHVEAKLAPRRELLEAFREAQPARAKNQEWSAQRLSEKERRAAIKDAYQAERRTIQADRSKKAPERKAAKSVAAMGKIAKDMALRQAIAEERQVLKDKYSQPYQARYRSYLLDLANRGDEKALAELRRQRDTGPVPTGPNGIEGVSRKPKTEQVKPAPLLRDMAYSIDRDGNVTYYADKAKTRAVLIDSGQRVTVSTDKDQDAIEAGLRLGLQKFGPNLKIDGSKEFKKQVIAVALKTGLRVEFESPAMNNELNRLRAERDEHQARGKAFIATHRANTVKPPAATATPGKTPQPNTKQPEAPEPPSNDRDIER